MTHTFLETRWGRVSLRRFNADAPSDPVIALHGWMDNSMTFQRLAHETSRPWIAVDLPGHGFSDHLPDYPYPQWIAVFDAILDALELNKPLDLVGHSMGGGISLVYAGVFPDRVRSVVSLDALGPLSAPIPKVVDNLRGSIMARKELLPNRISKSKSALIRARMAGLGYLSKSEATQLADGAIEAVEDGFRFTHDTKLKAGSLMRLTEAHVIQLMSAATCPILVIRPEDGFPVDDVTMRRRLYALKNVSLSMVEGHHHAHMTIPDQFARLMEDFWESLPGDD